MQPVLTDLGMKEDTVLIIDDNEVDILIASKNLELSGKFSKVVVAKNGQEALEILNGMEDEEQPSHILVDINMPIMDGWAFLDEFSERQTETEEKPQVYMLSSSINHTDTERARNNPHVSEFIPKPLNNSKIESILLQKK
ncbi:response regulator [bacterium SCSIO 12741]|nr:response regulator [bacterium SCSIO 12741]